MHYALHLYPVDSNTDDLVRVLDVSGKKKIIIGRVISDDTGIAKENGYFDSKVLSRKHAEVWSSEDGQQIFIKDTASVNGTYVNGIRLSPEEVVSEPFKLTSGDLLEIGVDVTGHNTTLNHNKVARRVYCIFSKADAEAAARSETLGH